MKKKQQHNPCFAQPFDVITGNIQINYNVKFLNDFDFTFNNLPKT